MIIRGDENLFPVEIEEALYQHQAVAEVAVPQKTPTRWFAVDDFPLTGSGKIQKVGIRAAWDAGTYDGRELT